MPHVSYELASPEVVGEKFQEGMFILNLATGTYFDVGNRYVALLKVLEAGNSVQALTIAAEQFQAGAGQGILDAVEKLKKFALVREIPAIVFDVKPQVCIDIFAAGDSFHIESHDDLLELIGADPVHDIDPVTGKLAQTKV